jgi:hypothetical protein
MPDWEHQCVLTKSEILGTVLLYTAQYNVATIES